MAWGLPGIGFLATGLLGMAEKTSALIEAEATRKNHRQALHKQRISQHPIVISLADELVSAEPIHAEKSKTQREHHWNRYEDEQSDAVGKNKQPPLRTSPCASVSESAANQLSTLLS